MLEQTLLDKSDISPITLYERKNFTLNHKNLSISHKISSAAKQKFKDKYKYQIAILAGLTISLTMMSRDCAPFFIELQLFLENNPNNELLVQVYFISNFFFPLFVGYITDYIGYHMGLISLHFPTLVGNLLILLSVMQIPFSLECAVVGRMLFSVGGESLQIILFTIVVNYFRKSTLVSYGLVITLSTAFLGFGIFKIIIFLILLRNKDDLGLPLVGPAICGVIFNGISFIFSIFLVVFEQRWKKSKSSSQLIHFEEFQDFNFLDTREIYPFSFWQSLKNVLTVRILTVSVMSGLVWGSLHCIVNYNSYFFGMSIKTAKSIEMGETFFSSFVYFFMTLTSFFLVGKYLDKTKQKNILMMIGCLLNSFSYVVWSELYQNYDANSFLLNFFFIIAATTLGIGMGLFSTAAYSSIPMMINEKNLTICFGIVSSITNLLLFALISLTPPTIVKERNFLFGKNPYWIFCCFSIFLAIGLEVHERKIKKEQAFNKIQNKYYCFEKK